MKISNLVVWFYIRTRTWIKMHLNRLRMWGHLSILNRFSQSVDYFSTKFNASRIVMHPFVTDTNKWWHYEPIFCASRFYAIYWQNYEPSTLDGVHGALFRFLENCCCVQCIYNHICFIGNYKILNYSWYSLRHIFLIDMEILKSGFFIELISFQYCVKQHVWFVKVCMNQTCEEFIWNITDLIKYYMTILFELFETPPWSD